MQYGFGEGRLEYVQLDKLEAVYSLATSALL
jgi:hypothetical protein